MAEYKNPNQQGGQDMKSILAMTVVFVVIFAGLQYFKPKKPATSITQQETTQSAPASPSSTAVPAAPSAAATSTASKPAPPNSIEAKGETDTVVENELYRITFTNRGAQVKSWILKKYKDNSGKPLDLVHAKAAAEFGYPLSLYTYDANLNAKLKSALFVPSTTGTLAAPGTLSFAYSDGSLVVHKTFHFDSSYVLHADVQVTQNGAPVRALLSWPAGFGDQDTLHLYASDEIDTLNGGKAEHLAAKKVVGGKTLDGPFDWAGVSDLYFAAIFLPDTPQTSSLVSFHNTLQIPKDLEKPDPKQTEPVPVLGAAIGDASGHTLTRIYAGPKAIDILKSVHATAADGKPTGPTLEPLVDFGFWGPIAKVLFLGLHFIYEHLVANWGWAIVIITVIINLVLLPLRYSTMKSSLKMQRIQPQINEIKEKYKKFKATDPRRTEMNHEIMALQKREGVNMFGGCLPMLIQIPLLFAFYSMLAKVIELRQAHWLWLPDLSAADPYHILPILMIVSQFLVQFYTPSPGVDPQQQKMMAFTMPAFTGFITWNYASGLALYWAIGNLISIAQQAVMNQTSLGREMKEIAARRARRKSGTKAVTLPARK
ncbi:MAG: membrane protein insertase YidC [Acidobacteriaceae bacterium]